MYEAKYCAFCSGVRNVEYCDECNNCSDCFACVWLNKKQFCILNKQYAEQEYWGLLDEIKITMLERKEYGEFFPMVNGNHSYLDSCAPEDITLTKDQFENYLKKEAEYFVRFNAVPAGRQGHSKSAGEFIHRAYGEAPIKPDISAHKFTGDEDDWLDDKILKTVFA